jgi:hypothetical protein
MRVPILPRVSLDEGMHDWRGMQVAPDSKEGSQSPLSLKMRTQDPQPERTPRGIG